MCNGLRLFLSAFAAFLLLGTGNSQAQLMLAKTEEPLRPYNRFEAAKREPLLKIADIDVFRFDGVQVQTSFLYGSGVWSGRTGSRLAATVDMGPISLFSNIDLVLTDSTEKVLARGIFMSDFLVGLDLELPFTWERFRVGMTGYVFNQFSVLAKPDIGLVTPGGQGGRVWLQMYFLPFLSFEADIMGLAMNGLPPAIVGAVGESFIDNFWGVVNGDISGSIAVRSEFADMFGLEDWILNIKLRPRFHFVLFRHKQETFFIPSNEWNVSLQAVTPYVPVGLQVGIHNSGSFVGLDAGLFFAY